MLQQSQGFRGGIEVREHEEDRRMERQEIQWWIVRMVSSVRQSRSARTSTII